MDEATGQKAFFTYKLNSTLVAAANYQKQLALWLGNGVADTSYEYQLLICDMPFFSGFFMSGLRGSCYKRCNNWCGDGNSRWFRSAARDSPYKGVAFNTDAANSHDSRLISVGLR